MLELSKVNVIKIKFNKYHYKSMGFDSNKGGLFRTSSPIFLYSFLYSILDLGSRVKVII